MAQGGALLSDRGCTFCFFGGIRPKTLRREARWQTHQRQELRDGANGRPWRAILWLIGVAIERDEACAIANHSLEPALANSAPAHLLQSFWLLSEHWACAAELSKPVFFNTTFCE